MVITHSVRVRPGHYVAPAGDSAALTIRGSNITVDLTGVTLAGNADVEHPDHFAGIAIRIDSGRNVTVMGYTRRIQVWHHRAPRDPVSGSSNNDLSHNWKPRLYSGIVKESLIDWLDYHQNEQGRMAPVRRRDLPRRRRLSRRCKGNTVDAGNERTADDALHRRPRLEQHLLLQLRSRHRALSLLRNIIMHNRVDWNVRGYSHGFYNRGQDSAGLLIYEQSSNNIVAYNSVTHSGDGLFLWAGQSTMDSGEGGATTISSTGNDFSYAPTNGMEATFSRNAFVENTIKENWHGLWGGYSFESVVLGNHFAEQRRSDRDRAWPGQSDRREHLRWRHHRDPPLVESRRAVRLGLSEVPRHPVARLRHPRQPVRRQSASPCASTTRRTSG